MSGRSFETHPLHSAHILDMGDDAMLGACADGKRLWLKGAVVPGDEVRFVPEGRGGTVTEILQPAPDRIPAPCPWFQECPGCALQPLPYARQLELKAQKVIETLRRLGGFPEVPFAGIQGSSDPLGTRNKLDFTVRDSRLGYRDRSGGLVEVGDCLLGDPVLRNWIPRLISWCKDHPEPGLNRCMIRTDGTRSGAWVLWRGEMSRQGREAWTGLQSNEPSLRGVGLQPDRGRSWETLAGTLKLEFSLAGVKHQVEADAFFQVHDRLADALVRTVMDRLQEKPVGSVLDLFCGTGAFTLPAAAVADRVLGLDSRPGRGPFKKADLRRGIPPPVLKQKWQTVITDPPRAGMEKTLVHQIRDQLRPERVLYISCNPATLARDLKRLTGKGSYTLIHVEAFDLFPQTPHVETVCELISQ